MKGKGRPKKGCAKKLNFNKVKDKSNIDDLPQDSTICNKEATIFSSLRPWMDLVVHITIVQNVYSQEISRVEKS